MNYRGELLTINDLNADSGNFKAIFTSEDFTNMEGKPQDDMFVEIINKDTGDKIKIDRWGLWGIHTLLNKLNFGTFDHFPVTEQELMGINAPEPNAQDIHKN